MAARTIVFLVLLTTIAAREFKYKHGNVGCHLCHHHKAENTKNDIESAIQNDEDAEGSYHEHEKEGTTLELNSLQTSTSEVPEKEVKPVVVNNVDETDHSSYEHETEGKTLEESNVRTSTSEIPEKEVKAVVVNNVDEIDQSSYEHETEGKTLEESNVQTSNSEIPEKEVKPVVVNNVDETDHSSYGHETEGNTLEESNIQTSTSEIPEKEVKLVGVTNVDKINPSSYEHEKEGKPLEKSSVQTFSSEMPEREGRTLAVNNGDETDQSSYEHEKEGKTLEKTSVQTSSSELPASASTYKNTDSSTESTQKVSEKEDIDTSSSYTHASYSPETYEVHENIIDVPDDRTPAGPIVPAYTKPPKLNTVNPNYTATANTGNTATDKVIASTAKKNLITFTHIKVETEDKKKEEDKVTGIFKGIKEYFSEWQKGFLNGIHNFFKRDAKDDKQKSTTAGILTTEARSSQSGSYEDETDFYIRR